MFQQRRCRSPSATVLFWDQTRCRKSGCSGLSAGRFVLAVSVRDCFLQVAVRKGPRFPAKLLSHSPVIVCQKNSSTLLSSFPKALPAMAGSRRDC